MGAPKGNKYGTKLKLPQIRQEAYQQFCDWIASGKPKKAWSFEHPKFTCTYKTMERYIHENPNEFPPITKEVAHAKSYDYWFKKGTKMMLGEVPKCQPVIFQMIMRNMFGWDKETYETQSTTQPLVQRIAEAWRNKK